MIVEQKGTETVVDNSQAVDPNGQAQESGESNLSGSANEPAWMKQLTGDLKNNEYLKQFSVVTDSAKKHIELREQLDRSVVKPGENATEEDLNKYYTELGRPEKSDGYEFSKAELPEGMKFAEGTEAQHKQKCFDMGLNQKQAQASWESSVKDGVETYNAVVKSINQRAEVAEQALKDEWGADYDDNIALVKRAKTQFLSEEEVKSLEKEGNANSPTMLKLLKKVGESISEGHFVAGDPPSGDTRRKANDGKTMLPYNDM
ncbi:hypothetical protein KAR91_51095 [Candidatus Pacearchaeota archaeon]|nr:hypothetical protein [Candidatus Pacearchaeota archaeon]